MTDLELANVEISALRADVRTLTHYARELEVEVERLQGLIEEEERRTFYAYKPTKGAA